MLSPILRRKPHDISTNYNSNSKLNANTSRPTPRKSFGNRSSVKRRKSIILLKNAQKNLMKTIANRGNAYFGDRIMGNRDAMNFDILTDPSSRYCDNGSYSVYNSRNIIRTSLSNKKIFRQTKNQQSPTQLDKLDTLIKNQRRVKLNRTVALHPERIMELSQPNEYISYLNFESGSNGVLLIAYQNEISLWNETTNLSTLLDYADDGVISSAKWLDNNEGHKCDLFAIGTHKGTTRIFRFENSQASFVRCINGSSQGKGVPVTSFGYSDGVLSIGDETGMLEHHDIRETDSLVCSNTNHSSEITELKWSYDGRNLVVVSKDARLSIWKRSILNHSPHAYFKDKDCEAVNVSWSCIERHLLAVSVKCEESVIKILDVTQKQFVRSIKIHGWISCIFWSTIHDEIAVVRCWHEESNIVIFDAATLGELVELKDIKTSVDHLTTNKTKEKLYTFGDDFLVNIWGCFAEDKEKARKNRPRCQLNMFDNFR